MSNSSQEGKGTLKKSYKYASLVKSRMSFLTPELLTRFDVPGPRYTSYPTADRFVEAFSQADLRQAL
jgi:hypothetical protein